MYDTFQWNSCTFGMAEGRLDRLKNLRARQRNNSISSPLSGSKSTDSGTVAVVSGPQLPRNADGTVKTKAHGNDAFSVGTMPWEPCAPRASLFLRIPTSVHEAEGTAVPLADPSLLWCLSLWSNDHRICHDVHTHVSAPPGRESSESGSNLFDSNTRVLRLDIIPPQTGTATLKVDLVHADVVLATSATQLTFELDAPPHVSTIELSGVSHGGTNVRLQATPAVSLAIRSLWPRFPFCMSGPVHLSLCHCAHPPLCVRHHRWITYTLAAANLT
jgi:hypothetical protein